MMLLMAAAVQAQRTQCINRIIPYPEKETKAKTRANIGNRKTYLGERRGLIILMEFQDTKFNNKNKNGKTFDVHGLWNDVANKEGLKTVNGILVNGSVGDYFRQQSYGQFNLIFDVKGPYTAKNKYAYYGRNKDWGNMTFDQAPFELIIEAVNAANGEVNFKDYDWDDDGEVDQVYVVYAGHGEASYDDADTIWPHESTLEGWLDEKTILQGIAINTYACGNELDPNDRTMGIGTLCHEFSHSLGLPDVYDAATGESIVGYYDVMDAGNYNGDGWYPAGYSSFERYFCGWLEPKRVKSLAEANLDELRPLHLYPDAYMVSEIDGSTDYYMVENRAKESWDKFLPGHGLKAWHINYDLNVWKDNKVNVDPDNMGILIVDLKDVPGYGTTAIEGVKSAGVKSEKWYDLRGRQLNAAPSTPGIYIIRRPDGTTQKHILK